MFTSRCDLLGHLCTPPGTCYQVRVLHGPRPVACMTLPSMRPDAVKPCLMASSSAFLRALMLGASCSGCLPKPCHAFAAPAPAGCLSGMPRCSTPSGPPLGYGSRSSSTGRGVFPPTSVKTARRRVQWASMSLGDVLLQPQFQVDCEPFGRIFRWGHW